MAIRALAFAMSLVFIFVVPWEGVIEFPGLGTAAKIIGFLTGVAWIASVFITNQVRKPQLFHILIVFFVLWNALSLFWTPSPASTVPHVGTWIQLMMMVLIFWDLYTTQTAIMAGLQAFILGEYVAIATAASNFLAGDAFYNHYQRFSPAAQSNPDGFGFIVVLGIPVAWYLASSMKGSKWVSLLRIINYAYIPAAFIGLSLSGTRTALIASLVGVAYGLSSLNRVRLSARIPIFLILSAAILFLLPHVSSLRSFQRFSTTYHEITEGNLNNRVDNWQEGLSAVPDQPFIGVGANTYRSVNSLGKLAHNSFLSVLVELGVIGFTLFAGMVGLAVIAAFRQPKWESRFWLAVIAVWGIGASTLTYEHRKATWLFLGMAIASAAAIKQRDEGEEFLPIVHSEFPVAPFIPVDVHRAHVRKLLQGG